MLQKIERSEGHRRLERLAEELRDLPEGAKFNMGNWTCCALGVATTIPEFQAAGLKSDCGIPTYRGVTFEDAAMQFFDITHEQAAEVFIPPNSGGWRPRDAADNIEKLLDRLALRSA